MNKRSVSYKIILVEELYYYLHLIRLKMLCVILLKTNIQEYLTI